MRSKSLLDTPWHEVHKVCIKGVVTDLSERANESEDAVGGVEP